MAQVSTSPTNGADEFATMAGNAIAIMVLCGLFVFIAATGISQESCIFIKDIITMHCDHCVIICNENYLYAVNGFELPYLLKTEYVSVC